MPDSGRPRVEFGEMMALARLADKQAPMTPLPHPKPRKSNPVIYSAALLNEMAVYRAWSRRVGGAGGWTNRVHETAMALSIKHVLEMADEMPHHLRDSVLCEAVIWDAYTLSIEHVLRWYDYTRGANPTTFLWKFCNKETVGRALAWHVPGRIHGRYMHRFSNRSIQSLDELRESRDLYGTRLFALWEERDQDRHVADIERLECRDAIGAATEVLTDDERAIIQQRYFKHMTFQEIADTRILTWGPDKGTRCVSLQRIQKIHAGALAKMRRFLSKEAKFRLQPASGGV